MITLRPAGPRDLDNILAWRNAPAAVRYSKSGHVLTREECQMVYQAALEGKDPARHVVIACIPGDVPIGYVRFDLDKKGQEAEISIAVDPSYQRKGFGTEALQRGSAWGFAHLSIKCLTAVVMETNRSSAKIFDRAGFMRKGSDGKFLSYVLEKPRP